MAMSAVTLQHIWNHAYALMGDNTVDANRDAEITLLANNVIQRIAYANGRQWRFLQVRATIVLAPATATYALPAACRQILGVKDPVTGYDIPRFNTSKFQEYQAEIAAGTRSAQTGYTCYTIDFNEDPFDLVLDKDAPAAGTLYYYYLRDVARLVVATPAGLVDLHASLDPAVLDGVTLQLHAAKIITLDAATIRLLQNQIADCIAQVAMSFGTVGDGVPHITSSPLPPDFHEGDQPGFGGGW